MEYLKMSELVEKTGVNKSTLLFYLKEGLLPEPMKLKPNVYRYHPKTIEVVNYIKYMQNTLGCPIAEIKEHCAAHDIGGDSSMLAALEQMSGVKAGSAAYDREGMLKAAALNDAQLGKLEEAGLIVPIREGLYGERDAEIALLVGELERFGSMERYWSAMVRAARELAALEMSESDRMYAGLSDEEHARLHRLQMEVVLKLKPYVFNRHTMRAFEKCPVQRAKENGGKEKPCG